MSVGSRPAADHVGPATPALTFGLAVPATMLTVSDAEAQTRGMQRREEQRGGRQERRTKRRSGS